MNVVEPGTAGANLIARAKELLLRPHETWDVIDGEDSTIEGLYRNWVIPLAAIPAVCHAVGMLGFGGIRIFGFHYQPSLVSIVGEAVLGYAMTLASVYVLALVVDEFALRFGGERSRTQAFKLAAYSGTAGWLAGVFRLLPGIGGLMMCLGLLYGLYIFYLGLPKLMRSSPEQTTTYFAVSLITCLVLAVLFGALTSCVGDVGGPISIY